MNTQYIDQNMNSIVAILVGALTILIVLIISFTFNFSLVENLVLSWIFTTIYAVFAFFLINDKIILWERVKYIDRPIYVDRPFEVERIREVIKEVPIQIPVENRTIEVVDRPIYHEVTKIVRPQIRNLNIPKWEYVASSQAKKYHKNSCRLGKLIKNKFKVHSHNQAFFKRKKYKACKMCIGRKK